MLRDVAGIVPHGGGKGIRPLGLKMPDFTPYDAAFGNRVDHVAACAGIMRGRGRPCAQRLHQMRPDLGGLAAIAEILQIGPLLADRSVAPRPAKLRGDRFAN